MRIDAHLECRTNLASATTTVTVFHVDLFVRRCWWDATVARQERIADFAALWFGVHCLKSFQRIQEVNVFAFNALLADFIQRKPCRVTEIITSHDLIFGAAKLNLKIVDLPIRYRERTYGATNISRWKHGWLLLKMVIFAALRLKFI